MTPLEYQFIFHTNSTETSPVPEIFVLKLAIPEVGVNLVVVLNRVLKNQENNSRLSGNMTYLMLYKYFVVMVTCDTEHYKYTS